MAKIPEHSGWLKRCFCSLSLYDVIVAFSALLGGFVTWRQMPASTTDIHGVMFLLACLGIFIASLAKALVAWQRDDNRESPRDLAGCLHTVNSILIGTWDEETPNLRSTVHVPINDGQRLQQVMEYVGNLRTKRAAGRTFPAQSGVIGIALRRKEYCYGHRINTNHEDFISELKQHWGYTDDDARGVNPATMSWIAIPLFDEVNPEPVVIGVVYFDSTSPTFFDDNGDGSANTRRSIAIDACAGIAQFVAGRYK